MAGTIELGGTRGTRRPGGATPLLWLALAAGLLVGCYRPKVRDGGFFCGEVGQICPEGFVCDRPTNTCRLPGSLTDAAPEVASDAVARDVASDPRPDVAEVACLGPVLSCTPLVPSGCDPFCQTGCACQEKCSVTTSGLVGCHVPLPPGNATDACQIASMGMAGQTDDCGPGLVCVTDHCGENHCARFCRTNADCPNATCSGDAGGGVKVCSVKFATCDPVGLAALSSCGGGTLGCYVSPVTPDRVICDCPLMALPPNSLTACRTSLDCIAGSVCVMAPGDTQLACRLVCTLTGTCAACTGSRFMAYNGSSVHGYCY